jgi:HlyD family secretion protein
MGVALGIVALGSFAGVRYMQARKRASVSTFLSAPVERGALRVTVSATGKIQGLNTVEVGAEVSGRVTRVHVDFNDHVEPGQLLAEIDPEQLKASIEEANARVASSGASIRQARATLAEAQANAARAEAQAQHGLMSQRDLEAARATAARAEAMVQSALADATVTRAALKSARWKLDRTKIVAPISGIVLSRLIEPGQTVTAGFQTPILFKLTEDLTRMSLHVYVDEADVGRVKEAQEATFAVDAYPERVFPSKVLSLRNEPRVDQSVVSYEAVLAVDNSELLLRPGMTATATIVTELRSDVLLVPNAALRFTPPLPTTERQGKPVAPLQANAGKQVWVLAGTPPSPSAVSVKVGPSDGIKTEIMSELAQGAEVLTDIVEKP